MADDIASPSLPKMPVLQSVQKFVATFVLGAFVALVGMLAWHVVPNENREILIQVVGNLTSAFMLIVGYYFGSTSSSKDKDNTISTLAAQTPPATTGVQP